MLRRDSGFTGSDGSSVNAPLEKAWEFKAGGDIESSPAVAYGLVFFGSKDKKVYALDAIKGQIKWIFKTNKAVTSTPVVEDGVVYVASEDKNLYALNADTGKKIWEFSTGEAICSTPAVGYGLVFFGCKNENIYALDVKTGKIKWTFESGNKDHSAPTISEGKLLISGKSLRNTRLYAFNAISGELSWKQEQIQTDSAPVIWEKTVLAREAFDAKRRVIKINLEDGKKQGYLLDTETDWALLSRGMIFAKLRNVPGSCTEDWVLFAFKSTGDSENSIDSFRGRFLVFSEKIYSLAWLAPMGNKLSWPAPAGEFVFFTNIGRGYHGILVYHTSKFMYNLGCVIKEDTKSYPVVSEGMVFIVSDKGKIHAFKGTEKFDSKFIFAHAHQFAGQDFKVINERPDFPAYLYFPGVLWPQCCCLCCGPIETTKTETHTSGKKVFTIENVPYCRSCIGKISKFEGGNKILFGESPGVQPSDQRGYSLHFRNEKYWAMFMELNGLRL